jgi:hypothetical protein
VPPTDRDHTRHWRFAIVLAITAAALARVIGFPFSIIDDPSNVVNNPLVAAPLSQGVMGLLRTTAMGYPHTVTVLSFAIDRQLWGVDPAGYHAVNLVLHLVNALLVYALLLRVRIPASIAWLPAAIFALHPIMVEPAAWVIGRKDLLAAGLVLGAMLNVAHGPDDTAGPLRDPRWIESSLLCVLAIFSKPSAIMAPALMFIFIRAVRPRWPLRYLFIGQLPAVAAGAFTILAGVPGLQDQGALVRRSSGEIAVDVVRAWALQVQHVLWPSNLLAEYERSALDDPPIRVIVFAALVTAAVAYAGWRYAGRRSVGRMALLFVPIAYLPAAGLLPTWHWTADSYFYLPMAGVAMATAAALHRVWRPAFTAAAWMLVAVLAVLSYRQAWTWSSGSATFGPVAAHYASDPRPLNRLAFAYLYENNPDAAAPLFVKLERMAPDFPYNRAQRAWAAYRLGDRELGDRVKRKCEALGDSQCLAEIASFAAAVPSRR